MDPFDAAARLQRLYQDAKKLPSILYREGAIANIVHVCVWLLLTLTVWRVAIARDAMRDSERSFLELYQSQINEENDTISELVHQSSGGDRKLRIVISDRYQQRHTQPPVKKHQVAPKTFTPKAAKTFSPKAASASEPISSGSAFSSQQPPRHCILLSQRELKHLVILLELKNLCSDIFRVWPVENGNIGLGGFWSSLAFTAIALGSPFVFVYALFPWLVRLSPSSVAILSNVACAYGTFWIFLAFVSILGVTRKIPAFREVRRVEQINLTAYPYCVRNYMAIASVMWEGFQLNTTSFSVWKMSYKPKQLAALTTIDLQDLGLGSLQVNVFESKQILSLVCLVVWFFCLKASNKFKSMQYLNYLLTFLLPNLLGGMLFMFLSKQFYQSAACFRDETTGATVMWANSAIECWTTDAHVAYALRGMFGMSVFVPLAVLACGSYQVFFPEVNLDVQTSPMLNVSAQIVKAAMMGALTFFVDKVRLFLGVALVGNLLLLFLVTKYELCSSWHLKYGKVLIYAMSSWSSLCAMVSTLVANEQKDSVPLYAMHIGWLSQVVICLLFVRRRLKRQRRQRLKLQTEAATAVVIKNVPVAASGSVAALSTGDLDNPPVA